MEFSAVNRRLPSCKTPLGPGAKKDGCFRRLHKHLINKNRSIAFKKTCATIPPNNNRYRKYIGQFSLKSHKLTKTNVIILANHLGQTIQWTYQTLKKIYIADADWKKTCASKSQLVWFYFGLDRIKKWHTFFNATLWQLIMKTQFLFNTQAQAKTILYMQSYNQKQLSFSLTFHFPSFTML